MNMHIYKSTSAICEIYEVSRDFFQRRIQSGEFIINEHYVKQANTIRWDFKAIERWWRGSNFSSSEIDKILNKILPD
ncbi:MAG: hypothetical protein NTW78_11825 [Campylobacterales bacterium]|nr:hypothetical protein [Campylobacterales bacterium]